MVKFSELGLSDEVIRAVLNMGFEETTPIQEQTIPSALRGEDLIGQAQTGTGKTAAYGIPLIERSVPGGQAVQCLVLTPTRELAVQVAEELNKIGQYKKISALPIYGGQDINRQIRALKKRPQIIVATPGRLMDHMRRKTIRLNDIKAVVLDEADEMLNMGFVEDIEQILQQVPVERQTMLFSATMPAPIQALAQKFMRRPKLFKVRGREVTVPTIEQQYIEVPEKQKFDVLCRLLDIHSPELAIVFGRTKRRVDELTEALSKRGYDVEGIHGDLSQAKRDSVMNRFKEGMVEVLAATDVAARGLDISGVTHVFNFDIPQDPDSYVHRIGRTGRAGKNGLAITFVAPREVGHLRTIEKITKAKITRKPIPTLSEAIEGQLRIAAEKLVDTVKDGGYQRYKTPALELLDEHDSVALVAAALKLLTKEPSQVQVNLTAEPPVRVKTYGSSKRRSTRGENKDYRGGGKKRPRK